MLHRALEINKSNTFKQRRILRHNYKSTDASCGIALFSDVVYVVKVTRVQPDRTGTGGEYVKRQETRLTCFTDRDQTEIF